jgi:hypothetical protein
MSMDSFDTSNSVTSEKEDSEEIMNLQLLDSISTNTLEIQRNAEKRARQDTESSRESEIDNDGFTTVRNRKKRIHRSSSIYNEEAEILHEENQVSENSYEVCLFSKNVLPKQFGMAKLLKSINASGILKITYKGPYKAFIIFKHKIEADKLLNCQKLLELDIRCQSTTQTNVIYGVVKNIDVDIEEKEIREILECDYEINSVLRLKRLDMDGHWTNSTAIRLCFKAAALPEYIMGYGCRFSVEPYIFPVTQCSLCWKYGHRKQFCPLKKVKCPKCGNNHENCDTQQFSCVNCKGPHMALDKVCPFYQKEKNIRKLMSDKNWTYKKALAIYMEQFPQQSQNAQSIYNRTERIQPALNMNESRKSKQLYSDVIKKNTNSENVSLSENSSENDEVMSQILQLPTHGKKKKQKKKFENTGEKGIQEEMHITGERDCKEDNKDNGNNWKNMKSFSTTLRNLFNQMKQIISSESSFEEKVRTFIGLLIREFTLWCVKFLSDGCFIDKVISMLNNG